MIPPLTATAATGAWTAWSAWVFYRVVQQDGSWYNDLKREDRDTFRNRASVTVRKRLKLAPSLAVFVGGGVLIWAVVYVFTVGLLTVVG